MTATVPHPVCARYARRFNVLAICGAVTLAVLVVTGRYGWHTANTIAVVAAIALSVAALRYAFLLHFRCPGREN